MLINFENFVNNTCNFTILVTYHTRAKKETFEGTNPEPKPNGKVFVFNAGSEKKLKRKRVSTDDFCRNQVKSQSKSKFKDTLFNYFTKPNSAGLT